MAINTLVTIKDSITAFAEGHGQLQGRVIFEADDHRSAYITEENTYPLLFVAPIDVAVNRAMNVHTLRVYVYERINDDRLDVWENANDTSLILRDIRVWWNDYGVDDINIVEDPIGQFGCDKELDNLVGYFADIRFEIPSHGRCQVPVDAAPIPPPPSCEDATQIITDSLGNQLYSNDIPSGATETQVIADSTAVLKDTSGTTISTTSILAEGSEAIIAPNAKLHIKKENDGTITNLNLLSNSATDYIVDNNDISVNGILEFDIHATEPLDIRLRDTSNAVITPISVTDSGNHAVIVIPDTSIEVNGTIEGTVVAGSTVDIQLSDSGGVVTPTSVTQVGNDFQIVLPTSGTPIDADAQAFLTATGLSGAADILAVNTFVTKAKSQGIWTDLDKIYPFIGGTATTHRYNLKNALADGTFYGGVTHNANGVTFNGTTGYFDTGWATNAGNVYNRHFSQYINSQSMNTAWAGSYDGTNLFGLRTDQAKTLDFVGLNSLYATSPTYLTRSSIMCSNVESSTVGKIYTDGSLAFTNTAAINAGPVTNTVFVGALSFNGTASFFHNPNVRFATTGNKLTASQQAILNTLAREFNSILGR
jgi:hypothetical protein